MSSLTSANEMLCWCLAEILLWCLTEILWWCLTKTCVLRNEYCWRRLLSSSSGTSWWHRCSLHIYSLGFLRISLMCNLWCLIVFSRRTKWIYTSNKATETTSRWNWCLILLSLNLLIQCFLISWTHRTSIILLPHRSSWCHHYWCLIL